MSLSLAQRIAMLSPAKQKEALDGIDAEELLYDWKFWGRPEQFAPPGNWNVWLICAGRGYGKTRAGAEWVRKMALEHPGCRIGLVARTSADVRSVMLDGDSGLMNIGPEDERPVHKASLRRVIWPNGSVAETFSAEEPDQLRGPQFHYAWADEAAAWKFVKDTSGLNAWDNLRIGTRLGNTPQLIATTTPKRTPFMHELLAEAGKPESDVVITRGSTYDNVGNLSKAYLNVITGVYEGTSLAQQELQGIMLDAMEGALFDEVVIEKNRIDGNMSSLPPLRVVSVDPSVAEQPNDECGITVIGATKRRELHEREAWVLEDATVHGSPDVWVKRVVEMARKWQCPIIAEKNQGHALIDLAIRNVDTTVKVLPVHSKVGKKLRAEPVAMAYEQGRIHHVGRLAELEAQMTSWVPGETRKSPDRLDALVHGITALLISPPKSFGNQPVRARSMAARSIPTGTHVAGQRGVYKSNVM